MFIDDQDLTDLKDARELVIQTESMLKHKFDVLEKNIELVDKAQNRISKIIYKLTGDKFYKPEETKEGM